MVFCKREVGSRPIALNMNEVLHCIRRLYKQQYTIQESFGGVKNGVYVLKNDRFLRKYKTHSNRILFSEIGRDLTSRLQKTRSQKMFSGARAFDSKSNSRNSELSSVFT